MGDGVALAVQKGDVQDGTGQSLLAGRGGAEVGSGQSGVGLVAQVGRDKESSHHALTKGAGELHQTIGSGVGREDDGHNQGRTDGERRRRVR